MIESISALTLATHDMPRAVGFYAALGFDLIYDGETHGSPVSALARAI
jgi:hypothetical protein